jgi:hypothetical protein
MRGFRDDLYGGPADETARPAVDGTGHEIHLSAKNAAAFSKLPAPYRARPQGRAAPARPAGRTAASRRRSGDIRAGAKQREA